MVGDGLRQLFDALVAIDRTTWQPAFSDAAMLVERHARDAYADRSYKELFFSKGLADLVLSHEQYRHLVGELIAILGANDDRAGSAAWALGKTYDKNVCPHLSKRLEAYLRAGDDEVLYQLIVALDNCGIQDGIDLIRQISETTSLPRASKLATKIVSRTGIRSG